MADYIFEVPTTIEGFAAMDPDIQSSLISEGTSMIPAVTGGNITISTVDFDPETNRVYYSVNGSQELNSGILSLNSEVRLAWWNVLLTGVAIAGAIACVVLGAPIAAIGLTVVAGIALAYDPVTTYVEAQATKAKTQQKIVELTGTPGNPFYDNPEIGAQYMDAVNQGWSSGIPWTTIIIGGMVGIGVLAGLYIFMSTRK